MMSSIFLFLLSSYAAVASAAEYEIAPITPDMQAAADAVVASMLPDSGVTQLSSVGWQRLAYITGECGGWREVTACRLVRIPAGSVRVSTASMR